MSAAEKLRALEQHLEEVKASDTDPLKNPTSIATYDLRATLHDALPQIVAVVEEAERVSDPEENELVLSGYSVFKDVSAALAALEEALK